MKVLLDFNIINNDLKIYRFWSCVLETSVTEIDYKYFNNDNIKRINNLFSLQLIASEFSETSIDKDKFIKRNDIFLTQGYKSKSPYQNSCSILTNYYPIFDFFNDLEEFLNTNEYERLVLVKHIIEIIKEWIGIDISNCNSTPGCIAEFTKYNFFSFYDSNFNTSQGERFIRIYAQKKSNYLLGIEITDKEKVLYKIFKSFENQNELCYVFPDVNQLEPFYEINISVSEKNNNNEWQIVYEENQTLVKCVKFNGHISGGNTRLLNNRYLNKTEKAILSESTSFSTDEKNSIIDIHEEKYNELYVGKPIKYLRSFYFDRTQVGREGFLQWARTELNNAKDVVLVDPYFDFYGLNDFCACATSYFNFSLITENSNIKDVTEKQYLANIQANFPRAKVYFVKEKLHDRYLFIRDSFDEEKCFSLSNSWNGTVKNFDLYIHEVEYENYLRLRNLYFPMKSEQNLQSFSEKKVLKKAYYSKRTFTKNNISELESRINLGLKTHEKTYFIEDVEKAYWACYCGKYTCKSYELDEKVYNKLKNEDITLILGDIIQRLILDQKENFKISRRYINSLSGKSISELKNPQECLDLMTNKVFSGMHSYDLELNYSLFKIATILFYIAPNEFIEILVNTEKQNCLVNDINYFVSEPIISAILDSYKYFLKTNESIINFANKIDNLFCKIFFAKYLIDCEKNENSELELVNQIMFSTQADFQKECAIYIFSELRNRYSIRPTEKAKEIVKKIDIFVLQTYINESFLYSLYVINTFLKAYNIDFEGLNSFINGITTIKEKNQIQHIVLYDAIYRTNDNKLRDYLLSKFTSEEKKLITLLPQQNNDSKRSIVDVNKYINYIPFLSSILSNLITEDENIIYKFRINKYLIFDTVYDDQAEFDVYKLTIIFSALLRKGMNKQIASVEWFIPTLINSNQVDFYGLNLQLLDIYISLLNKDSKNCLIKNLKNISYKIMIASTDAQIFSDFDTDLKYFFSSYMFEKNDNLKSLVFILFVFIHLSIQNSECKNDDYQKDLMEIIENKLKEYSQTIKIQDLLNEGLKFFNNGTNKKIYLDKLENCYLPVSAMDFFGVKYE